MKNNIIDLLGLIFAFSCSWHFRENLPVIFRGPFVLLSTSVVAIVIMKVRRITFKDLGLISVPLNSQFIKSVLTVSFLIFIVQSIGIIVIGSLIGNPNEGSAITNQPQTVVGFILDIVFMTWVVTGLGEEFVFRGIIMNRFGELFKNTALSNFYLISGLQAIWFGLSHPSQGASGMIITGLIGFFLGTYLLKRSEFGLWPLIVAHGIIDTIVLTINFIST